jgi:hypothetical protein
MPLASTLGDCCRQAVRTMDSYLLVVSGVSTLWFSRGEAKRIRVVRVAGEVQDFHLLDGSPSTHTIRGQRVMKTIRRLSTRLVLETEAGLVFQWMWYRLDRRQDTSELEHSLRSRDALRLEQPLQTIKQKMKHRRHIFLTYASSGEGG